MVLSSLAFGDFGKNNIFSPQDQKLLIDQDAYFEFLAFETNAKKNTRVRSQDKFSMSENLKIIVLFKEQEQIKKKCEVREGELKASRVLQKCQMIFTLFLRF